MSESCLQSPFYFPHRGQGALLPLVGTPHHLLAQRGEVSHARAFHYPDAVRSFLYSQQCVFAQTLGTSVNGHKQVVGTAFHLQRNLGIVGNDNRAHIK